MCMQIQVHMFTYVAECDICRCVCVLAHAHAVFIHIEPYFNARALFFEISMIEEFSQPIKHANKILVLIFLTVKVTRYKMLIKYIRNH